MIYCLGLYGKAVVSLAAKFFKTRILSRFIAALRAFMAIWEAVDRHRKCIVDAIADLFGAIRVL